METRNIYAVALLALKPDPATQAIRDVTLLADAVPASSEDEAKERCLARLREKYPVADGWTYHFANTCMVDADLIKSEIESIAGSIAREAVREMKGERFKVEPSFVSLNDGDVLELDEPV